MIFFITLFRYFTIVLFFTSHFFSFSQGMQTRERAHCARSVFPVIKKKKKLLTPIAYFGETLLKVAKNFLGPEMPLSVFWREREEAKKVLGYLVAKNFLGFVHAPK